MASSLNFLLLFFSLLISVSLSHAQRSNGPDALVLPVIKDGRTLQYVTHIDQRTPHIPIKLVVDLGGRFLWVDCDSAYISSSYNPIRCRSVQCSAAMASGCGGCFSSPKPGCNKNTCGLFPENTITHRSMSGELGEDIITIRSTDGSTPGPITTVHRFLFSCAPTFLLEGLASGVKGMAGLGGNRIALPSQFAGTFNFHRKFAICLSSSITSNGVIFFGDGPYVFLPNIDVSKSLMYTPLIINPVSTSEYFVGVKSIKINGKRLPLNASLLSLDEEGVGGTKLSTIVPYTTLETSIYNALTEAFMKVATSFNMARATSVAPFGVCFSSKNIGSTRFGPAVPTIDFVLQSDMVHWRMFGANSMVRVSDDVLCLGFLDGGLNPRTSIVIGGYQLEDNLLQFDLATSRMGFSSSLLIKQTTCSSFDFDPLRRGSS